MRVLVTGADGFVGQWLVQALLGAGHQVTGAVRDGRPMPGRLAPAELAAVDWVPLDLEDPASIDDVARAPVDGVVHLAAVASSVEAGRDPSHAWAVNAAGTARLVESLAGGAARRVVVVSTAEVYGAGPARPRRETDPVHPLSPYAASKAAAEIAALEAGRRTGLAVMVARPFPHTGPGQTTTYVAPAFLDRIRLAQRTGAVAVKTGNLDPVRELLDVRDVAAAYLALLERGRAGEVYNVARGEGIAIGELFERLARAAGVRVLPEPDPSLLRTTDVLHLVGDPTKITSETAWAPRRSLDQTLRDLVDAQAH
ncbi:MAG TPA: NAD-dependent epimerase/dehydratase family protein [Gemmatimonadales bacterium]|nr:NAD-dependent epimerase/dehydratase family protein [Gemmatimonadales bacterium]